MVLTKENVEPLTNRLIRTTKLGQRPVYVTPNWAETWRLRCCSCATEKPDLHFPLLRVSTKRRIYALYCKRCSARHRQAITRHRLYSRELHDFVDALVSGTSGGARTRALRFEIGPDDVLAKFYEQSGMCALSGVPMTYSREMRSRIARHNVSIDRIDSAGGYTPANIQLVCFAINIMKSDMTEDELRYWCSHVVLNHADDDDEEDGGEEAA